MSTRKEHFEKVKESIEHAVEAAEEEKRRRLLAHRIELARSGIISFQKGEVTQAVRAFHTYIRILEDYKQVREGGLLPSSFDRKKDMAELLMISGVYWDLVKLYDKTQSPEKQREFLHYLEKYISFSKGMPFQALCAETIRKYLNFEKPLHRDALKNAYRMLNESYCFVVSSLVDVTSFRTLPRLREFRDEVLNQWGWGQKLTEWYYSVGPQIADRVDRFPYEARVILGKVMDMAAFLSHLICFMKSKRRGSSMLKAKNGSIYTHSK